MKPINLIILICIMSSSFLEVGAQEIYQIGNSNTYCAGYRSMKMNKLKEHQKSDMWCWAACIETVLRAQGLQVDQCAIVEKGFGVSNCPNRPANCRTISGAAGGWNINGRRIKAWVDNDWSGQDFIGDLAYKYPVIVGLNMPGQNIGHAYVVSAIYFTGSEPGNRRPFKVILRDPWPGNPSRVELSWNEFYNRLNCVTHVTF